MTARRFATYGSFVFLCAAILGSSCTGKVPGAAAPAPVPTPAFWAAFGAAQEKLEAGDVDGARASFKAALELHPTHSGANYEMAFLQIVDQDWSGALISIDKALENDSPPPDVLYLLRKKEILKHLGRQEDARRVLEAVLEQEPKNADAYAEVCELSLELGDTDGAIQWARRALDVDPDPHLPYYRSRMHYFIGTASRRKGDLQAAEEELSEAMRICNVFPAPYRELSRVLEELDREEEAKDLAWRYEELHRIEKQIGKIRSLMFEADPLAPMKMIDLARLHIELGQLRQAEAYCDALLETSRGGVEPLILKGTIKRRLKNYASAERYFRQALEISPRLPAPRGELALLYAIAEDDSIRDLDRAWKMVEEAKPLGGVPALVLAELYVASGDVDRAITTLRRGLTKADGAPEALKARIEQLEEARAGAGSGDEPRGAGEGGSTP